MKTLTGIIIILLSIAFAAQNNSQNIFVNKLLIQYDEEKFAHDYYSAMYDQWKVLAFKNLSKCEEVHMKVIKGILVDFGEENAIKSLGLGIFTDPELTKSYKEKMLTARKSESEALVLAGNFEEKYIVNLEELIKLPEGQANEECLDNLLESSVEHLNLVVCHLRHRNVDYRPVQLSVARYIKCIGDQYADLDKATSECMFENNKQICPFMQEQ